MKFLVLLAAMASAALASPLARPIFNPATLAYSGPQAPFHTHDASKAIAGKYMVVLRDGVSATNFLAHQAAVQNALAQSSSFHGGDAGEITHLYDVENVMQGYAGRFSDDVLAFIRAHPEVAYVEQDSEVKTQEMPHDDTHVWNSDEAHVRSAQTIGTQDVEKGAPWGLVRVSHRERVGFGNFGQYLYDGHGGEGVTAYVIDTGINIGHVEFEGRARWGKTMPQGDTDTDGNGHGTHCAGTIASRKYGVAKKAELVAVKVLGSSGSGSMSDVTGGVLWAVSDAKRISKELAADRTSAKAQKHKGFVANMSLGGGKSPTLDKAVNGAVDSGLHFAVAAGNENADACGTSPAGAGNPITAAAGTIADERAYFSNWGKCADLFAPGLNILSTWNTGNTSTNTISGTSMASPHIAGMLAYYLSLASPPAALQTSGSEYIASAMRFLPLTDSLAMWALKATQRVFGFSIQSADGVAAPSIISALAPQDLKKTLVSVATKDIIKDVKGTPNLLLFNNATSALKSY